MRSDAVALRPQAWKSLVEDDHAHSDGPVVPTQRRYAGEDELLADPPLIRRSVQWPVFPTRHSAGPDSKAVNAN